MWPAFSHHWLNAWLSCSSRLKSRQGINRHRSSGGPLRRVTGLCVYGSALLMVASDPIRTLTWDLLTPV